MADLIYEVHCFSDPQLPFIFHKRCSATARARFANWHENIEILFCTEGNGTVHCNGRNTPFSIGDIFIVNADSPHTLSSDTKVRYQCLIIDSAFCTDNGIAPEALHFRELIRDEDATALFRQVAAAYEAYENTTNLAVLEVRIAVLRLLQLLCARYTQTMDSPHSTSGQYVKAALQYIRSNLTKPMTLDQIAQHVRISKFHLSRQFRELTGSTVIKTINLMRCTYARQLLENGASVSEAARISGFDNLSYFSRTFVAHMGCLPSAAQKAPVTK